MVCRYNYALSEEKRLADSCESESKGQRANMSEVSASRGGAQQKAHLQTP